MDRAWRRQTYWRAKLVKREETYEEGQQNGIQPGSLVHCQVVIFTWMSGMHPLNSSYPHQTHEFPLQTWSSLVLCLSEWHPPSYASLNPFSHLSFNSDFWFITESHWFTSLIYLKTAYSLCSLSLATLLPHATNNSSRSLPIALSAPLLAISSPLSYFSECGIVSNTNLIRLLFHPTLPSIWPFLNTSGTSHCSLSSYRTFAHAAFSAWNALLHPNALSCPYPFTS